MHLSLQPYLFTWMTQKTKAILFILLLHIFFYLKYIKDHKTHYLPYLQTTYNLPGRH
jgi:hypothetical protein